MEFNLQTLLLNLPDGAKSQEFMQRLEVEGESADLLADVDAYIQSLVDACLDEAGAPVMNDDDPALEGARHEAIAAGEAALQKYQEAMAHIGEQISALEKSVPVELDQLEAEDLKKKISDVS